MNKYRIVYRQKIASEESDYGEWTDEFLRVPYLVAKNMNDAITFAKYYTKELGYDVEEYEWRVFEYEGNAVQVCKEKPESNKKPESDDHGIDYDQLYKYIYVAVYQAVKKALSE